MTEARKWIVVARDAFHYDMGVMTAKEKSIYKAFIELDDRVKELEKEESRYRGMIGGGE
jgi:hypothetical protein